MPERRPNWKLNLAMLWLSQLLVMAGFSAMIPFIPLFMKSDLHVVDEGKLAIYVSMFNFFGTMGYAIFCPIWGKLSDRFGVKPMLLRGTFLTALFFPMMGYVSSPGWLISLRFLTACLAGTTAASQVMIARTAPDDRQGFSQGVLTTAIWAGAMLGNVVGGLTIYYFNYKAAFWFCGILYFLSGFAILPTRDEPIRLQAPVHPLHAQEGPKLWFPRFTQAVWIMFALFLLAGLIRSYESPYVALKVEQLTSSESASYWTGIISAVVCCGAICAGAVGGWLADHLHPRNILIPVFLLSAVALFLQGVSKNLWVFTASRTLLYLAAGGLQPLLQKILTSVTPRRKRGTVFGFSSLAQNGGVMLAAVFGGWTILLFDLNGVFYVAALFFAAALPVFLNFLNVVLHQKFCHLNAGVSGQPRQPRAAGPR